MTADDDEIAKARQGPNLRELKYSPLQNPLLEAKTVKVKNQHVTTGKGRELVDLESGEVTHVSVIHAIQKVDDIQFVKLFKAGIVAYHELSKTAARVFYTVMENYDKTPMKGGYADSVYLYWWGGGLFGQSSGMSKKTFDTGMKELLAKNFLAPKTPNVFWVNPHMFFKGNRALFVKEYQRNQSSPKLAAPDPDESAQGGLFGEEAGNV